MDTLNIYSDKSVYEHEQAVEKYTRQLVNNPDDIGALNNRGISLVSMGIGNRNIELIRKGKADIEKAAGIAIQCNIIKQNLKWSQDMLLAGLR